MRKPTLKQRRFVKRYLETANGTQAIQEVYNVDNKVTAANMASRYLNHSGGVRSYLQDLLDEEGLTDQRLAKKLKKIVNAGTTQKALSTTTPKDALSAIKLTAELKDLMPTKRIESKTTSLNLNLKEKTEPQLQETLDTLVSEITNFNKMIQKQAQ